MLAKGKELTKGKVVKKYLEMMGETASNTVHRPYPETCMPQTVFKIQGAVDDFLRNLLERFCLCRTLRSFESEWYGSAQKQMVQGLQIGDVPNALKHHQLLQCELQRACNEAERLSEEVLTVAECFMMVQREKDFHQLQYRQDFNHKNMLIEDITLLQKHIAPYELALQQIQNKYQAVLKHKMLISIEKDRIQSSKGGRLNQKKSPVKGLRCNNTTN